MFKIIDPGTPIIRSLTAVRTTAEMGGMGLTLS